VIQIVFLLWRHFSCRLGCTTTGRKRDPNCLFACGWMVEFRRTMCLEEKHHNKAANEGMSPTSEANPSGSATLKLMRLAFCAFGICICYICYGIFHEQLFQDKRNNHVGPSFILFTQCITNVLVAVGWQAIQSKFAKPKTNVSAPTIKSPTSFPHALLLATSICYVIAMVCSNEAIAHVSYPVAVLVKSCKLIPTMIIGQVVSHIPIFFIKSSSLQKRIVYSKHEWVAAFCISVGILLFHYSSSTFKNTSAGSSKNENRDSLYGMYLLCTSLFMDGILSSCQNFLKKCPRPPNAVETMLFINFYALFSLGMFCSVTGQFLWLFENENIAYVTSVESGRNFLTAVIGITRQYAPMIRRLLILNVAAAFGQIFIFLTITWYTPVITTMITTTRKFITILLSVLLYGHAFSLAQWVCVIFIFLGLYIAIIGTTADSSHENGRRQPAEKSKSA
jgi:solute carrier family 35 (UDP-galactose transporter), member B1